MKANKLIISLERLDEFELINVGNKMPNLESKLKEIVGEEKLNDFLNTYHDNKEKNSDMRYHEIGTLILNAKLKTNGAHSSFGMEYSGMVCVTYHNNSSPNLLEFFIVKK